MLQTFPFFKSLVVTVYEKPTNKQMPCKACSSLKLYLVKLKRKHISDNDTSHTDHQQCSSDFPYEFLSPASKKARMVNIKKENRVLKVKVARLQSEIHSTHVTVNEVQASELSQLVQAIMSTDTGQSELEKIFSEADMHGGQAGSVIRNIWESDTREFYTDQLMNCK